MANNWSVHASTEDARRQVERDFDRVVERLRTNEAITELAGVAVGAIRGRTESGLDVENQPFAPYSDMWAEVRARNGLPIDHVTLKFTGEMFEAIEVRIISPTAAELRNEMDRAEWHQHGDGVPERKWFGIDPTTVDLLHREARAIVLRILTDDPLGIMQPTPDEAANMGGASGA